MIYDKYLAHALQHPLAQRPDVKRRVMHLPVCEKCERVAFRVGRTPDGRLLAHCPVCGWKGVATRTLRQHVKEI